MTIGDATYLSSYLINTKVYGVVVPPGEPAEFWATYEVAGDNGTLFMAAVLGPDGLPGRDAIALKLQTDTVDSPDQLPSESLTNTEADIGRYWLLDDVNEDGDVIGSSMYVWYGSSWRRLMLGSPGPPGPTPIITPTVELVEEDDPSEVIVGGTPAYPTWHLKLNVPPGPEGPAPSLYSCPDVDFTTTRPQPGDILGFTGSYTADNHPIWVPVSISQLVPAPFSMPESSFTSFTGISQRAPIGSLSLPPQPYDWIPIVWGHCGATGVEVTATPLSIGCEVRMGHPQTGTLVARGFGSAFSDVAIMPHFSSPGGGAGTAIAPGNGHACVPANHTEPSVGTLYVNLYNDGAIGLYAFSPADAQLFILVMPVDSTPLTQE